jgi:CDP-4-dehydro-6-deoxyglucose reductase
MLTLPIREAVAATPRAHIVRLELQNQSFFYRAGQAAYLQPQGAPKPRPYSIASAPEETAGHGLLEFLVQTGGEASSGISAALLRPGRLVSVEGPFGSFTFPDHPRERRFAFIAGGTGIAPLRSMMRHVLLAERSGHIALIYSVRGPEEFAYLQEFEDLEASGKIAFRHTVTRAAADEWSGRLGRIDASGLKDLIDPGNTLCFVCGPPPLVGDIPPQLKQLGVRDDQIRVEQWTQ